MAIASAEKRVIVSLVDELGRLDRELARLKKKTERVAVIRPELVSLLALEPDDAISVNGSRFLVQIGEQTNKRIITDMPRVFEILGEEKFVANCSFPLAALDQLLNAAEREAVLFSERTGPRSWKTFTL